MPNLTRLLTKPEFLATFHDPMLDITGREDEFSPGGVIDLHSYVAAIPKSDLPGHSLLEADLVEFVRRSGDDRFDQVAYPCREKNVYLVVVVSLDTGEPYGHFLLDLGQEYGLD